MSNGRRYDLTLLQRAAHRAKYKALPSIPKRIGDDHKGHRCMPAGGIIKMLLGKRRTLDFEHPHQLPVLKIGLHGVPAAG